MAIRINNINLSIDEPIKDIDKKVCKKLKISNDKIKKIEILKESLDARKKNDIKFNYCVDVFCENEIKILSKVHDKDVKIEENKKLEELIPGDVELKDRPVVVGFGPAGIFAALMLAQNGYKPIVFERGEDAETRTKTVEEFWKTGKLNLESNVQFREGGF